MKVVRTLEEARRHDVNRVAAVELPGHLVRPAIVFRDESANFDRTGPAELARGIEMLMIGLADMESSMIDLGMSQCIIGAAMMTRSPDEVLAEVIAEESANVDPNPPGLRIIPGGIIPIGDGEETN